MSKLFVTTLLTVAFLSTTQQQYQRYAFPFSIPPVACPQYFQYVQSGSEIVGLLTIPFVASDMELFVYLSQRAPLQTNYFGKISLASDGITVANQVLNGGPISYRVEFPTNNEIPKLTKISVNGQDICVDSEYPRPSTRLYLNHKLRSNSQTSYQSRPLDNNFISLQGNSGNPVLSSSQFLPNNQPSPSTVNNQRIDQSTQCGEDSGISAFIYGGDQIMRGQYPWLTAIYAKSAGLRFLCGGSLLSTRTVLSAAHCFKLGGLTANRLVVNVGRYNLEDYSEQDFQTREIQNLIIHPEYSTNIFPDADLAILHLRQPVQYTNYIRPICLWAETVDSRLIVGSQGVVAGWGGDETGRSFTPIPKKVEANIVSDSECLRSSQAYSSLTSSRTLCAGNRDGSGPCMGDSGSGLMINRNGRWYLRGIVSAGQTKQQKCDLLQYVVFCDVAKHLAWVQSNTIA